MSQGQPMPWADAKVTADRLVEALRPGAERIEIAGSIRRRKAEVHDIEIVAMALLDARPDGLFGTTAVNLLEERIAALMANGNLAPRMVENHRADGHVDVGQKLGPAFKALITPRGIAVDLFVVRSPASWGCIYALRTGPGDWNTRLVTECKAIGRKVEGGQVWRWAGSAWVTVPTPEEADFFRELGQAWVEPEERSVERVRIERAIADGAPA